MAESTDIKVNEFIVNITTEELLKTQTIEPNQIYVTADNDDDVSFSNGNFTGDVSISGNLTVNGNIIQSGDSYETHAEKIYTTNDYIYLRENAISGLSSEEYSGLEFILYDGTNNGRLVIDNEGVIRAGDINDEKPLALREEDPTNNGIAIWNNSTYTFETNSDYTYDKLALKSDLDTLNDTIMNQVNSIVSNLDGYLTQDDLSNYVTQDSLSNYVSTSSLTSTLSNYVLTSSLSSYVTSSTLTSTLSSYVTSSTLTSTLSNYATTSSLSNYVDLTSAQTLSGVKTFSNGVKIGDCTITYDSSSEALVFSF